jgi:hypothetical protein
VSSAELLAWHGGQLLHLAEWYGVRSGSAGQRPRRDFALVVVAAHTLDVQARMLKHLDFSRYIFSSPRFELCRGFQWVLTKRRVHVKARSTQLSQKAPVMPGISMGRDIPFRHPKPTPAIESPRTYLTAYISKMEH